LLFKFDFGILITFGYIAILVFCHFECKTHNHAHFLVNFGGSYREILTFIILIPKVTSLGENASFEPSTVKIHLWVRPGRVPENKKTGQYSRRKRHNSIIFHIMWGEAPANDTLTKFGTGVDVQDIITHAKY